jgi:hypothetical protein
MVAIPLDAERVRGRPSEEIARRACVATTYGSFGFQGHTGFNEPPRARWGFVSLDELRDSVTRVVPLVTDTIIAQLVHEHPGVHAASAACPPSV